MPVQDVECPVSRVAFSDPLEENRQKRSQIERKEVPTWPPTIAERSPIGAIKNVQEFSKNRRRRLDEFENVDGSLIGPQCRGVRFDSRLCA